MTPSHRPPVGWTGLFMRACLPWGRLLAVCVALWHCCARRARSCFPSLLCILHVAQQRCALLLSCPAFCCAGAAFCALRILTICHTHAQTSYLSVRGHVVLSPRLVNDINIPICLYSMTRLLYKSQKCRMPQLHFTLSMCGISGPGPVDWDRTRRTRRRCVTVTVPPPSPPPSPPPPSPPPSPPQRKGQRRVKERVKGAKKGAKKRAKKRGKERKGQRMGQRKGQRKGQRMDHK